MVDLLGDFQARSSMHLLLILFLEAGLPWAAEALFAVGYAVPAHCSARCMTSAPLYAQLAWAGWMHVSLVFVLQYADTATVEKQEDAAEQVVKQAKLKAIERLLWGADADPLTLEPGERFLFFNAADLCNHCMPLDVR